MTIELKRSSGSFRGLMALVRISMRRDASFAEAKSRFGMAKPDDLLASGDPVESAEPFVLVCWREAFLASSGEGSGGFILILRGVRGACGLLMSTDITLRIIPSRN